MSESTRPNLINSQPTIWDQDKKNSKEVPSKKTKFNKKKPFKNNSSKLGLSLPTSHRNNQTKRKAKTWQCSRENYFMQNDEIEKKKLIKKSRKKNQTSKRNT
jgi:hypothetical protein